MSSYLSKEELIKKLSVCGGLIPVDLDTEKRELIWRDLGQFHNYEGFFSTSLATFSQLRALGDQKNTEELSIESSTDRPEQNRLPIQAPQCIGKEYYGDSMVWRGE